MKQYLVTVVANAKINKIVVISDNKLKVWINAVPQDGEANKMLINQLAKYFNISKNKIQIVKGEKTKYKLIEVAY